MGTKAVGRRLRLVVSNADAVCSRRVKAAPRDDASALVDLVNRLPPMRRALLRHLLRRWAVDQRHEAAL